MRSTASRIGLTVALLALALLVASLLHDLVLLPGLRTGIGVSAPTVTMLAAGFPPIWRPRLATPERRCVAFAAAALAALLTYAVLLALVSATTDIPGVAATFFGSAVLLSPVLAWAVSRMVLRSGAAIPEAAWWPRRPTLEQLNHEALRLYATDDLRHLYHGEGPDLVRLRDGIVSRAELRAVILWRVWWDRAGYWLLLGVTVVGAVAAVVAAVEGWH